MLQWICGTCDKAKKYNGDKNTEKGIRSNLMVSESTEIVWCKLGLLIQPQKIFHKENQGLNKY